MKFLHLISSLDPSGGGPIEGARQLHKALTELGHEGDFACLDAPQAPWVREFDAPAFALGPARGNYGYCAALLPWLRHHRRDYDAVIVNGLWQYPGLAAWRALADGPTPYFVFPHGMLDPWFKHHYPLKHLKKWLYWPWAEYQVLRHATGVLFTCEEERMLARQSFWLYRCREFVVSHGISPPPGDPAVQRNAFLRTFPALKGQRFLLFLGRLHEKKGCDLLLEAFARSCTHADDLHLVMAGPDPAQWQGPLQEMAARLGIAERVCWTGMLSGDLKWGAFHAAEAFCLPSHQENFGIAVVEALACNCPVLISNKVNIWREIEADDAGLVESDTLSGTMRLLSRWQALAPEAVTAMRLNAHRSFERRFRIEQVAQNLLHTIECARDTAAPPLKAQRASP